MKSRTALGVAACVLCFICVLFLPNQVQAAEYNGFTYEVHDGKATITGCTLENNYVMEIPATIDGHPVVSIGAQAFEDCTDLLAVKISEGVQTIEAYAFYQCYNLTWLELPNSLISIGDNAFCNCRSLDLVYFGDNLKTIGDGAFSFCRSLDDILILPYKLESIGVGAFYDCNTLEQVRLPNALKELGAKAFAMCDRLDYIYIPDGVERIGAQVLYQSACYYYSSNWYGDAFYMGPYLLEAKKSISGSYTTLNGITNIADGAFENCYNLTEVILPDSLRIIGASAFECCDGLQSITIPSGVTTIGDKAFYWCEALADICIPDTVVSFGQDIFTKTAYYKNEENWENSVLYVGNYLLSCKTSLSGALQVRQGTKVIVGGAMKGLTKLTELTLPDTLMTIGNEAVAGCTALIKVTIADGVTSIGEKAFYYCSALKTVYFGRNVSQIGASAFGGCSNLEIITVHSENETYRTQNNCLIRIQDKCLVMGCKTSQIPQDGSVTTIGSFSFEGREGLTEITIPDVILTIGEGAFRDCNELTTVNLGNGVQIVGKRAFEECDVLSQINLGQSIHTIDDYGFAYNHQLRQVEFPASLRYLGEEAFSNGTGLISVSFQEGLLSIGKNCFTFCENLTSLNLPDSLEELKDGAFYSCEKIATLTLGEGLITIGSSAFDGCKALDTLVIPGNVQTIGSSAFYECTSLRQVDLGNVKEIGYSAFESCRSLTQVHIPASVTELGRSVFAFCPAVEQMTVSPENRYYHSQDNCIIYTSGKYLAFGCKSSIIPTDGSVTILDAYSFAGCTGLKSIVVPDQITRICAYTFYYCSGLESMQLPFIGGESSYDNYIGYVFGGGPSQNDMYVPASLKRVIVTGGTTVGDSGFSKCSGLREIILPDSITTIGYNAFANCSNLQWVVVPGNLQSIKHADIFSGTPYAMLRISAGQENTIALVKSYDIRHQIGGLITFADDQNRVIDKVWYPVNAKISIPKVPETRADNTYTYTFSGWDREVVNCAGNAAYTAIYTSTYIDYTVVFKDWDGTVLLADTYHYGDKVITPDDPQKVADSTYVYAFAGWDSEVVDCLGNATYTATYTPIKKAIVFVEINGEKLKYDTLVGALEYAPAGSTVQLTCDIEEDMVVSKKLILDLNGFDITGNISIASGATLSVKDSQTDDYTIWDGAGYGKIIGTISGAQAEDGYMMITEEDGVSFHRIDLQLTDMSLRSSAVGVYYKCNFAGDEIVAQHVDRYGVALSVAGMPVADALGVCSWYDSFISGTYGNSANGTLLRGIMKTTNTESVNAENAERPIYGRAYILTKDGRYIFGKCDSRSLREQVELIDNQWSELTMEQQLAVINMYQSYKTIMDRWDIPNILTAIE